MRELESWLPAQGALLLVSDETAGEVAALVASSGREAAQRTWPEWLRGEPGGTPAGLVLDFGPRCPASDADWEHLEARLGAERPGRVLALLNPEERGRLKRLAAVLGAGGLAVASLEATAPHRAVLIAQPAAVPESGIAAARAIVEAGNRAWWAETEAALERERLQRQLEAARTALQRVQTRHDAVSRRFQAVINSQRWKFATILANHVRHPGMHTLRLPLRGAKWVHLKLVRRGFHRGAARLRGLLLRKGAAYAGPMPTVLSVAPDPVRVQLGNFLDGARSRVQGTPGGGVYLIAGGDGTPETHALTPNDWAARLEAGGAAALVVSTGPEFETTGWRGALAGTGASEADALMKLMYTCQQRNVPVVLHVAPPASRSPYSSTLLPLVDAFVGRPEHLPPGGTTQKAASFVLQGDRFDPEEIFRQLHGASAGTRRSTNTAAAAASAGSRP